MTKLLRFTSLLLCFIACIITSSAEKLYLSSIECKQHPFENKSDFSFKSVFSYNESDNITQIETNQHIDSSHVTENVTVGQPPYYIFKFDYQQDVLFSASYADIYADSLVGSFKTEDSADGKTVITDVTGVKILPDIHYVLKTEYNDRGELTIVQRLSENGDVEKALKYEYTYDKDNRISQVKISDDKDNLLTAWILSYGENGELTECLNGSLLADGLIIPGSRLKFDYNIIDSETEVVSPEPVYFIYDTLGINPKFENTYTLYIPEFVAHTLRNQKGISVKSIEQSSNIGSYSFGCQYMPASDVEEIAFDTDVKPMYYNIQGMPVNNPTEGEIHIVKRGSKATKEVYRR